MATTRKRILVSFTAEERADVQVLADQVRLSVSELLRRLVLSQRIPDGNDFAAAAAIGDLLKINADLARIGNLLKLTLDEADGQFGTPTLMHIEDLVAQIRRTQETLLAKVEDLHFELHPRRKRPA